MTGQADADSHEGGAVGSRHRQASGGTARGRGKAWRALELFVASLERLLEGEDVEIRSPDFIPDRDTGQLREVDVSVRRRVGSVHILIIFECRKRRTPQDVTWIEQIATKATDIGAQKAVAVSARHFTAPAVVKAARKGIDLRTVDELSEQDVLQWMGSVVYSSSLESVSVAPADSGGDNGHPSVVPVGLTDRCFVRGDGTAMTLGEAFPVFPTLQHAADSLPLSQPTQVRARIEVVPNGQVSLQTGSGLLPLAAVTITATVQRRLADAVTTNYVYAAADGVVLANRLRVTLEHDGTSTVIDWTQTGTGADGSRRASVATRREDHDTTRVVRLDLFIADDEGAVQFARSALVAPAEPPSIRRPKRQRAPRPSPPAD